MTMEGVFKLNKDMMEENAESMKKLYEINSQFVLITNGHLLNRLTFFRAP